MLCVDLFLYYISDVVRTCLVAEKVSKSTFHTVMHAMYKLITMLLCNHGDIRDVQAHLEHIKNTILTEVSVIIQDINHAKVIYYCVCVRVHAYFVRRRHHKGYYFYFKFNC